MTKLEKLYSTIQNLKELGLELGEDLLKQTNELEQEIIKKEILPVISEKIEPIIGQIQRELVLVVDCHGQTFVNKRQDIGKRKILQKCFRTFS